MQEGEWDRKEGINDRELVDTSNCVLRLGGRR